MTTVTVDIAGKSCTMAYGLRALFLWEQCAGRRFEIKTLTDTYLLYWCCLLMADPTFMDGDFAAFIEAVDADPGLGQRLSEAMERLSAASHRMEAATDADDKKKG